MKAEVTAISEEPEQSVPPDVIPTLGRKDAHQGHRYSSEVVIHTPYPDAYGPEHGEE